GNRRDRPGGDRQSDGPPRGRVEALADRSPGIAGAGWDSPTMARGAPGGGLSIPAVPTTAAATPCYAGASRGPPERRVRAPLTWHPGCRGGPRTPGFSRVATDSRSRRAD